MGVPERRKRKRGESIFDEIMSENFPIPRKEINIQIQEQKGLRDKLKKASTKTH